MVVRVIQLTGPTAAHELVLSVLDSILGKRIKPPIGVHDYDYFDQELRLITRTGLQEFVDCVAEWVDLIQEPETDIKHNRLLCPKIKVPEETSLMICRIQIGAIRADLEAVLTEKLKITLHQHQGTRLAEHTGEQVSRYEFNLFFVQSFV